MAKGGERRGDILPGNCVVFLEGGEKIIEKKEKEEKYRRTDLDNK